MAGQTLGGAVMAAAAAQADSAGVGARPGSVRGGVGGEQGKEGCGELNRCGAARGGRKGADGGSARLGVSARKKEGRGKRRRHREEISTSSRGRGRARWSTCGHGRREAATASAAQDRSNRCPPPV